MDRENFEFLNQLTKEQRSDLSKSVRDMVTRGRVLLAVERYKKGEASLGRAAELAGVPFGADDDDLDRVRGREQDRRGGLSPRTRDAPKGLVTISETGLTKKPPAAYKRLMREGCFPEEGAEL